jgi:hypothetical protein
VGEEDPERKHEQHRDDDEFAVPLEQLEHDVSGSGARIGFASKFLCILDRLG